MMNEDELAADNTNALLGVGDRLKAEREARGLSLDDVSQSLKISRRVLEQIESNAWGQMSGYTFARGVVRCYAKFVRLEAEPLLRELENSPLPKPPLLELPQSTRTALPAPGQSHVRDRLAMVAGVFFVAVAVLAYFLVPESWLSDKDAPASPLAVRESTVVPSPPMEPVATTALPLPLAAESITSSSSQAGTLPMQLGAVPVVSGTGDVAPGGIVSANPQQVVTAQAGQSLLILRFDQVSWVEVRDRRGNMILSENVSAGSERTVNGEAPIELALGNADGVRVIFRGKGIDLKPHTRQKVARLSLE